MKRHPFSSLLVSGVSFGFDPAFIRVSWQIADIRRRLSEPRVRNADPEKKAARKRQKKARAITRRKRK